jgi:hypothetical protein
MNEQPSSGMTTLTELIAQAAQNGYEKEFRVGDEGLMVAGGDGPAYAPEDVHIPNFYRFEGPSNPDDMAILYLIETGDGMKGTLTDAYGPYADSRITEFIKAVEDIHKGRQA